MASFGRKNSVDGYNSNEVDWNAFYRGITPGTAQITDTPPSRRPTDAQMSAIRDVSKIPSWMYQSTPTKNQAQLPAGWPWQPGSETALAAIEGVSPTPKTATNPAVRAAMMGGGLNLDDAIDPGGSIDLDPGGSIDLSKFISLPRRRPGFAPTALDMDAYKKAQKGANPGLGGALIGGGKLSPLIPPQEPPADGLTPLPVWADGGGGGGSPLVAKALASRGPSGSAGGFRYENGKKVGYATMTIGGNTYTPTSGARAYELANAAGKINALNKQATATGQTGAYTYQNGVKTGTVNGGSGASAYEAANKAAAAKAQSKASKPSSTSQSFKDWAFG